MMIEYCYIPYGLFDMQGLVDITNLFLIGGNILTNKLMSQWFLQSRFRQLSANFTVVTTI
jgi:hypothetical protein